MLEELATLVHWGKPVVEESTVVAEASLGVDVTTADAGGSCVSALSMSAMRDRTLSSLPPKLSTVAYPALAGSLRDDHTNERGGGGVSERFQAHSGRSVFICILVFIFAALAA